MYENLAAEIEKEQSRPERRQWFRMSRSDPDWTTLMRIVRRSEHRETELQAELAAKFGELFGGKLTKTFSYACLARGRMHDGGRGWERYPIDTATTDHPFYYRRNRRAAALVAHLYNFNRGELERFAWWKGVVLWVPDFPSWHYPGGTKLVAYLGPVGLEGLREHSPALAAGLDGNQADPTNLVAGNPG